MPRPRVFISSTYFDLRHVRTSLSVFLERIGFDPILSEKGHIAYSHDDHLDHSCYQEVIASDILILIVGGRYGSVARTGTPDEDERIQSRYSSVTQREFATAIQADIPVFILVDSNVLSEHRTYQLNRDSDLNYAHVDDARVFEFLDHVLDLPRNNPLFAFDLLFEAEEWLMNQFSGLFQKSLRDSREASEVRGIQAQVTELRQVTETLKVYLENLLEQSEAGDEGLVEQEERRLTEARIAGAQENQLLSWLQRSSGVALELIGGCVLNAKSLEEFRSELVQLAQEDRRAELSEKLDRLAENSAFMVDLNALRVLLGGVPIPRVDP